MEQKRKKRKRRRLRKGIFAKIIMGFLGIFILSLLIFAKVNPILLDSKEPVVEYKSEYDPRSNIKNVFFHNTDEVKIEGTVNTNEIGTYTIYYVLNNKKIETKVQVKDTTAPKLQTKDLLLIQTTTISKPKTL